ncbi:hypothetical protein [Lysobacter sp. Root559]|uniref:hypothetical protein n=1 Tax=Lysobacter sp. Root559 TaxID=1736559 RepID=UPI0012FAC3CA|nr:hypothetical protein [Lysobacter sp. Root559]
MALEVKLRVQHRPLRRRVRLRAGSAQPLACAQARFARLACGRGARRGEGGSGADLRAGAVPAAMPAGGSAGGISGCEPFIGSGPNTSGLSRPKASRQFSSG